MPRTPIYDPAEMMRLFNLGHNQREIADIMGCTPACVYTRMAKLGVPERTRHRNRRRYNHDEIVRMRKDGHTLVEICEVVGCAKETALSVLRSRNLTGVNIPDAAYVRWCAVSERPRVKFDRELIVRLFAEGKTVREISEIIGATKPTVYRHLVAAGIRPSQKRT